MTCNDCLNQDSCSIKNKCYKNEIPMASSKSMENYCIFFKDRSRFVELPCKVGDKIYVPTRNFVSEYEISYFHIGKQGMWFNSDVIDGISTRLRNGDFDDIGKTVFLTREEAEQALKEREVNGY